MASNGEHRAANWIAQRLRELGCRIEVEQERAHSGYWWLIGLSNTSAVAVGLIALRRTDA